MNLKRRGSKTLFLMAVYMAFLLFQSAAFGEQPMAETKQNDADELRSVVKDYSGRESSFVQYLKKIESKPYATELILLPASEGLLSLESTERIMDDTENSSVLLKTNGWMEWHFTAKESAVFLLRPEYMAGAGKGNKPVMDISLDGEVPYNELTNYALSRVYCDKAARQDNKGNDLIPEQTEVVRWQDRQLWDVIGLSGQALCVYIEKGEHTIRIVCKQESLFIRKMTLGVKADIPTPEEAMAVYRQNDYKEITPFFKKFQAEKTFEKSDVVLYPLYDRNSPATEPYHLTQIRRNTIGRSNWSKNGMWITYEIEDIPEDGLYYMTIKYRQLDAVDVTVFRNIYINGEILSSAFENVSFFYGINWNRKTISDKDGQPCPLYLKKGRNEIRMEVSPGRYTKVLQMVDYANYRLNQMYAQMVMVTGTNPDRYRDYYLDKEIPGLLDSFKEQAGILHKAADLFDSISGEKSSNSEVIQSMAYRLDSFIKEPNTIPLRISSYRDGISSLSSWLNNMIGQPLEMDYFIIHSADSKLPSPEASFFENIKHFFGAFIASFFEDYNIIGEKSSQKNTIDVWANVGRDQIQVLKNLIMDDFTPASGINVNLSVVQAGFIEATLAGRGPEVAIAIARGQPVNLACRGALLDFERYSGFEDMKSRFADTAMVPYQFNKKTYGIPCTQTFYMLFYRKDILEQMNIKIPKTWDDIFEAVPKLQRSHMTIGLPYSVISAATAVDNGLGAKDLFATLLLQNGGAFYNDDFTASKLDSEIAVNVFKNWCDFYTKYGFDLAYDFYTRFKTGELPIGIASYEMYNTLSVAAEEIRGLWGMASIPGTRRSDGSISHAEAGAGTAVVIFKNTADAEKCYKFVDWWTSNDIQQRFCTTLENLLGPAGRFPTANLDAFSKLSWSGSELEMITKQRQNVFELPEIPGSYYVSRSIDNAFRAVIFDGKNPRETFEKENRNINREITRKHRELGLAE